MKSLDVSPCNELLLLAVIIEISLAWEYFFVTGSPGQLGLQVAGFPGHWVAGSQNVTEFHVWRMIVWLRLHGRPVWARKRFRISPPRFLAASVVRGNWTRVVLFCCILGCLLFLIWIEFVYMYFSVLLFCLSVSVKWLAVKTASEMTYTVSSGALNSTPTNGH